MIPSGSSAKAPTAELRDNQTDQDTLPPYEVLDEMLACLVEDEMPLAEIIARGHGRETVKKVERLLYLAEYKRRQAAPGVKISARNFGRDRRYPITNKFREESIAAVQAGRCESSQVRPTPCRGGGGQLTVKRSS